LTADANALDMAVVIAFEAPDEDTDAGFLSRVAEQTVAAVMAHIKAVGELDGGQRRRATRYRAVSRLLNVAVPGMRYVVIYLVEEGVTSPRSLHPEIIVAALAALRAKDVLLLFGYPIISITLWEQWQLPTAPATASVVAASVAASEFQSATFIIAFTMAAICLLVLLILLVCCCCSSL